MLSGCWILFSFSFFNFISVIPLIVYINLLAFKVGEECERSTPPPPCSTVVCSLQRSSSPFGRAFLEILQSFLFILCSFFYYLSAGQWGLERLCMMEVWAWETGRLGGKVPLTLPAGHLSCLDFMSTGPRWHSPVREAYSSSIT